MEVYKLMAFVSYVKQNHRDIYDKIINEVI